MKVDFARAKAKRDSCAFYHRGQGFSRKPICEKIGYRRPFLATCSSCHSYTPVVAVGFAQKRPVMLKKSKECIVCGAPLHTVNPKVNRCHGSCKNSLLAYLPIRRIIIEEIQENDLYGIPLT